MRACGRYGEPGGMENGGLSAWLEVEFVLFKNREIGGPGISHTTLNSGDVCLGCDRG